MSSFEGLLRMHAFFKESRKTYGICVSKAKNCAAGLLRHEQILKL